MAQTPAEQGGAAPSPRLESWPQRWARAVAGISRISPGRRADVLAEIHEGSQSTSIYYVLLGLSELIAGFALIVDSDATLIGANVVAPLMTPIFGVSLGLLRGDMPLLRSALLAEFGGAALGIALCFVLGLMPFTFEPSRLLLSQTHPTLIDLLVAVLAGCAGVLAMIDERISPALPGVAIATALNPPIAAIGLCLAYGSYGNAWGAFLLFFANVLAILAVAAVLFLIAGFVRREEFGTLGTLARRFSAAVVGLAVVTVVLTGTLTGMVRDLRTNAMISSVLDAELAREPGTALIHIESTRHADRVEVLSTVNTPRILLPERVRSMQAKLAERLGEPVQLFVRCSVTKDVAATGSTEVRPYLGLRDDISTAPVSGETRLLVQAEQFAREIAETRPDLVLNDVEFYELPTGPVLIFSILNARQPSSESVWRFEEGLRKRLADANVRVIVRTMESNDMTSKGRILFGAAHFGDENPDNKATQKLVEDTIASSLQAVPDVFVTAVDAIRDESGWHVRTEVVAPRPLAPSDLAKVEKAASAAAGVPVDISARMRSDLIVTAGGYSAAGNLYAATRASESPVP